MNPSLKLTAEVAAEIRARVKKLDFGAMEKVRKAESKNGTFDVIISTEVVDRAGEIVRQDGLDDADYKNNPIVLWGHDYFSLPIGICTDLYKTTYRGVPATGARGVFFPTEINPLAQQVRRMYDYGVKSGYNVGCTTSIGFIPKEFDPDNSSVITRWALLEFSFVPVPANQGVGPASGRALTFEEAKEIGLDVAGLRVKGLEFSDTKGWIPKDVSDKAAPIDTPWKKPTLEDFTDKQFDELSDAEKRHIAGYYAWAAENPPATFGDMKLPHHRPSDGAVVWNGLKAAMGALMGARGGVDVDGDKKAVYEHLAKHYKLFDKEAPEFKSLKAEKPGDECTMDDGGLGVLATDPKDPDGALVCVPSDPDKEKAASRASEKGLIKSLHDEHERHTGEVEKAIDEFRTKSAAVLEDRPDSADPDDDDDEDGKKASRRKRTRESRMREHLKDLTDAMRDEHDMHRAKAIAVFRSFDPSEDKAFDKKPHLKALRDEHDAYEDKHKKALDEFEERMVKTVQGAPDEADEHTDWITGKMEESHRAHKKAVTKIAKGMVRDAYGEEERTDEKTLAILKEYLAPHIDPLMLNAIALKVGARISAATRERLREAHEHMKAASAIVEDLHGGLRDGEGEEGRGDGDGKTFPAMAPVNQRSRPAGDASGKAELDAHLFAREVLRGVTTAATTALERLNKEARDRNNRRSH